MRLNDKAHVLLIGYGVSNCYGKKPAGCLMCSYKTKTLRNSHSKLVQDKTSLGPVNSALVLSYGSTNKAIGVAKSTLSSLRSLADQHH